MEDFIVGCGSSVVEDKKGSLNHTKGVCKVGMFSFPQVMETTYQENDSPVNPKICLVRVHRVVKTRLPEGSCETTDGRSLIII